MLLKIILKNIKENKLLAFITIFVISIVIFFSIFLDFTYKNIKWILINEKIWQDENKFIIQNASWNFITNKLKQNLELKNAYQKLKKNENIENIYWIYLFKIPTFAELNFLNLNFETDMLIFTTDSKNFKKNNWDKISLWLSNTLLNIYNTQVWWFSRLPRLNKDIIKNININISFWKNSLIKQDKIETKKWIIKNFSNDFPIFWLTMTHKKAKEIQKEIKSWEFKLIKIVWTVKKSKYTQNIKNNFKNLKIKTFNDIKLKIKNQTNFIKDILNFIKYIIYIVMLSFLISLWINLYEKNKKNIKIFHYHGAWFFKQFSIIFYEINLYLIIAIIINIFLVFLFNQIFIKIINRKILEYGFFNINFVNIWYLNIIVFSFIIFIFITISSLISFWKQSKK